MMVARFIDAFTDVAMGRICDRSRITKNGKFRPWILRMSGPVAISSFLIYQSGLREADAIVKVIWLFITYILWGSIFYTSINIPYGSMASAISREAEDRQSLSTYRTMGSTLAGVIIGVAVPLYTYKTINGQTVMQGYEFTTIAGLFSIFAVVCYLLCYFLTTERVSPERTHEAVENNSLAKLLKNAAKTPGGSAHRSKSPASGSGSGFR
jgi:GPH family glycoside/pentoside/hexuronide:cation symporter